MNDEFSAADLEAYLDEDLDAIEMARIELRLRDDHPLLQRLESIHRRRDAGIHSLGEIWRRNKLSCPDRETLGSFLLGVLDPDHRDYVSFHLDRIGCRYCQANLEDLRARQEQVEAATERQRRYFQSSAGYLR